MIQSNWIFNYVFYQSCHWSLPNCSSTTFDRIFAPKCNACGEGITPVEGTSDTVRVVAMEKDFHVDCYVCEVISFSLTKSKSKRLSVYI